MERAEKEVVLASRLVGGFEGEAAVCVCREVVARRVRL